MTEKSVPTVASFEAFLTSCPPGSTVRVVAPFAHNKRGVAYTAWPQSWKFEAQRIFIHCRTCGGERWFDTAMGADFDFAPAHKSCCQFIWYRCGNCQDEGKMFAVEATSIEFASQALFTKIGEDPSFGPPLPSRLLTLLRDSEALLSAARRCENQSMGIGAFVYYRRVLDNQRGKLLDEIIKATETLGGYDALIEDLKEAKGGWRFSESVEKIKHALPQSLYVKGQNPLTLLHSALSKGVHDLDDAECLKRATAIRTVLSAFAERLHTVIAADDELAKAVETLNGAPP